MLKRYCVDPGKFSPEGLKVWSVLDETQRLNIQADNPFMEIRNLEVVRLVQRGVKGSIVSEISGISTSTIGRIIQRHRHKYAKHLGDTVHSYSALILDEIAAGVAALRVEVAELKSTIQKQNDME